MRIVLISVFCLLSLVLKAQNFQVKFNFQTIDNQPVNREVFYSSINSSNKQLIVNNNIRLQKGNYILEFYCDGFNNEVIRIPLKSDTIINIKFRRMNFELSEVIVKSFKNNKLNNVQNGFERLTIDQINQIPTLLGEKDLIKSFQFLPGINSSTEGAADLNVRGGTADQNLILLDNISLFNTSHLLGLDSIFNSSIINYADIYKTGFPARFGGKISSVLDVKTINPSFQTFYGNVNLGVISGSAFVNIPIKKDTSGLIISGRRSTLDLFRKIIEPSNETYSFYDSYIKYSHKINEKANLNVSFYSDRDKNSYVQGNNDLDDIYSESALKKGQIYIAAQIDKNSIKSSNEFLFFYSKNRLRVIEDDFLNPPDFQKYLSDNVVQDLGFKWHKTALSTSKNKINFGVQSVYHVFDIGQLSTDNSGLISNTRVLPKTKAIESSVYLEDDWQPFEKLKIRSGIRLSQYVTTNQGYVFLEPRFNISYNFSEKFNVKASYNKLYQPVQTLINNGLGLPIDILVSSDDFIKPQSANQISLGINKQLELFSNTFDFSLEGYYMNQNNIITYKDGFDSRSFTIGSVISVDKWQDGVATGSGINYGLEFSIEKKVGKYLGWFNYTLSKVSHSFLDLDQGKSFSPRQDRRHVLNLVQSYKLSKKWSLSYTFNFSSGQAITLPLYSIYSNDIILPGNANANSNLLIFEQGERGASRMKVFHKLDIGAKKEIIILKKYKSELDFGFYNLYNRRNSYFYTIGSKNNQDGTKSPIIQSVSLLPIIPYISLKANF